MTFDEVADSLPNGFHDAELERFEVDIVLRQVRFDLAIWIGVERDHIELYRPARLTLTDVSFIIIEPPDIKYQSLASGPIVIDTGEGVPRESRTKLPKQLRDQSTNWMYLGELNRFLLFSAASAKLEWTGNEEDRG